MGWKFENNDDEILHAETPDEEIGSVDELGWFGLYRGADLTGNGGVILAEDNFGFVTSTEFDNTADLDAAWKNAVDNVAAYENLMEDFA